MEMKLEVALIDGTSLEGIADKPFDLDNGTGIHLNGVFRSNKKGTVPLAKRVFVPWSNILFIVIER